MNEAEIIASALTIATTHAERIEFALTNLQPILPLDSYKVENLNIQNLLYLELFTNRFAKLQDYMGSTLFDMCLQHLGDVTDGLTIIDKVNKLVKYNIIESEALWREFRKSRNHISHEYPSRPDLTAQYINATVELAPKLLACNANIAKCLSK
jgi:hypothetical protein